MAAFFVVNFRAGHGLVASRWTPASSEPVVSGWMCPQYQGHAAEIAREAAAARFDPVVAVGGDGTVNEVVNGLMQLPRGERPALAVIPAGTANDFARNCGIPLDWDAALRCAASGRRRTVDLGAAAGGWGTRYVGIGAFLGAPAVMAEAANRLGKAHGGILGYLPHLPRALRYRRRVRIVADGDAWEQVVAAVEVANGPSGGGLPVNPGATIDDGLLDLLVVAARSVPATLRVAAAVPRGRHMGLRGVTVRRVSRVSLEGDDVVFAVDGEILGTLPATVEVCPGALDVIVPGR